MITGRFGKVQVLIADDHPVVRGGLKVAIHQDEDLEVVAEASDGAEALEVVERLQPHIAVIDINMPKVNGIDASQQIRRKYPSLGLVILTAHDGEDLFHAAMDVGANGYLLKDSALIEIVTAIHAVSEGGYYVTRSMMPYLLQRTPAPAAATSVRAALTPSEWRIIRLIALGKASREIASELGLSARTIENRRTAICEKLGIHGSNALLRFALEQRPKLS
jgi:DNA-binding NarL/FixJ family response regulator